ncbi:hypothetical protein [Herpetosiphon giganteus]|uniref:hypothetical protein n=1 Tax=Herpetosiphon giganteus TaxID=2029754 RepID=UPI001959F5B0|nr:hypothetical protein [Herpetosiphon giganteus]MBM7846406.1 hypothetical protein [Herpetosiphon giganteus]
MSRFGWILILILTSGCSINAASNAPTPIPTHTATVSSDWISINMIGYELTCLNDPTVSIQTADGWKQVEYFIMQPHYLDGQFEWVAAMCDYVVCNRISEQSIRLPLYEYIGQRSYLLDREGAIHMIPAYKTVLPPQTLSLSGSYFLDQDCTQQQTYSTTIDLSK